KTFLRTAVNEVLPDLPEMSKDILEEHLQSLGVDTDEDLQFIEEADLLTVLRPIQARKVLAAWKLKYCSFSTPAAPEAVLPMMSRSPGSSSSTSSNSCQSPEVDWVTTFVVPWDKLPEELMQLLERGKRPNPRLRREMIRIVANEMMRKSSRISKSNSTEVAKQMVAKYPSSLQDVIEGDVIGAGYHSLVKQLQNRIENMKRSSTPKIRKRKTFIESDTDEVSSEQRAEVQDTYGCTKWDVKFLPLGETTESQLAKKEKLKKLLQECGANPDEMKHLMEMTFYTQRKEVNHGKAIKSLLDEWPFWFEEQGMAVHFKELTGLDLKQTFLRNLDLKGKRLLIYFNTECVKKSKTFQQALLKFKVMRGQQGDCSADVMEMVLLLLSYFNEKEEAMFCHVDDVCLPEEVKADELNLTPTIVVCGRSCFSAGKFMLSLDRNLVEANITSFISALCMMFASYYNFNIHYPLELASTLEFLQRCFFSINPERGTKVEKRAKSRLSVNPRVLTLIQELSDFEWRDM
ncbi:hypothetical protein FQA47_016967, partial [Oryzias melastigma]